MSTRSTSPFFAMLVACGAAALTLACGGKIVDGGAVDSGPATDSGITPDGYTDVEPPPGSCGVGACTAGYTCNIDACTTCICSSGGGWACTAGDCFDTMPPPPPPPSMCPGYVPPEGTYCYGALTCLYKNECGRDLYAICDGKTWHHKSDVCPPTTGCPKYEPSLGSYCASDGIKCGYPNACMGTDYLYCSGKTWKSAGSDCPPDPPPPPPPGKCPAYEPAYGSACSADGTSCKYPNGCGGADFAYCKGGTWIIDIGPCPPPPPPPTTCPTYKPASGAKCAPPSSSACSYPSGFCTSYCFCADDYRWACITPPCSGGDAGPPYSDVGYAEASPGL